jgi:hypothetical protein
MASVSLIVILLAALDRAHRTALNGINVGSGTRSRTNCFTKNYIFLIFSMVKNYIFIFCSDGFVFISDLNIPFDRARRDVSGTHQFIVGTHDCANKSVKNSNQSLTSLT